MNNNNYFGKPIFPGTPLYSGNTPVPNQNTQMALPLEQSYIENILRLNKGKNIRVHMTFPDSTEFRDREFSGIIEQSGRDQDHPHHRPEQLRRPVYYPRPCAERKNREAGHRHQRPGRGPDSPDCLRPGA